RSAAYDDAALEGIRRVLGAPAHVGLLAARIAEVRMGTTGATNALLERKGEPVVLVGSRGDTTVADAYLSPVLSRYTQAIARTLDAGASGPRIFFMTSNGGLATPEFFRGK